MGRNRNCSYCLKEAYNYETFSGLPKKKFCMSCWYKIYDTYKSLNMLEKEPEILKFVLKIKNWGVC